MKKVWKISKLYVKMEKAIIKFMNVEIEEKKKENSPT